MKSQLFLLLILASLVLISGCQADDLLPQAVSNPEETNGTAEGLSPRLVTNRTTWFNSGDAFAFISYGIAHVFNFDNHDLWLADLVNDEVIELLPDKMGGYFAFSPDGAMLLLADCLSQACIDRGTNQSPWR